MLFPVFSLLHDIVGNMILVLDTDVLVSGLRSNVGASRVLLLAVAAGEVTPLVSVGTVLEYEAVLKRPAILRATCLTDADVDDFLDDFIAHAREVETDFRYRPLVRDPDDEMFMELAINGQAAALVSFNLADFRPVDRSGPDLPVCRPGEILRRLAWRPSVISRFGFPRP